MIYNLEQINPCIKTWSHRLVLSHLIILLPKLYHSMLTYITASTLQVHKMSISFMFWKVPQIFLTCSISPASQYPGENIRARSRKIFHQNFKEKFNRLMAYVWEEGRKLFNEWMLDVRHNARFFHITSFDLPQNLRDGYHYTHFNN